MTGSSNKKQPLWPELPYSEWKDTLDTLHMYMQIVGKVKLALAPFINQWWEVTFYVTARGMTTGRIPYSNDIFSVDFDFIDHKVIVLTSQGKEKIIPLEPRSVAEFYKECMRILKSLDIDVTIHPIPTEVPNSIPFQEDTKHASYNPAYVTRWWRTQLQICVIFDQFRTSFRGKSSPIHFFWGSFDLNGTRFSGKKVDPPDMKGEMGRIMKYAENEENFAFGFWPGDTRFPEAAFYTYMYPNPTGMEGIDFGNCPASFNENLSECILPYTAILKAKSPKTVIMHFLETSYQESAKLAGWNIKELEGEVPSTLHEGLRISSFLIE